MLPMPVIANEPEITYIGITSDVHGSYDNFTKWMDANGDSLKYIVFGGDMDNNWNPGIISTIKTYAVSNSVTPIFTMGNHDWSGSNNEKAFEEVTECTRTGIQNNP